MSAFVRSGKPEHVNGATANNVLEKWPVTVGPTTWLQITNTHASVALRFYLTKAAADADVGYDLQPGYLWEAAVEVIEFWTKTATGIGSFQAIAIGRI